MSGEYSPEGVARPEPEAIPQDLGSLAIQNEISERKIDGEPERIHDIDTLAERARGPRFTGGPRTVKYPTGNDPLARVALELSRLRS